MTFTMLDEPVVRDGKRETLKKEAIHAGSFRYLENPYQAVAFLQGLSTVGDKRTHFLFRSKAGDELYERHTNTLNGTGGWVSEHANVTGSYVHYNAVVMAHANVHDSQIGAGAVVDLGRTVHSERVDALDLLRKSP